jgi:hypothetical protein
MSDFKITKEQKAFLDSLVCQRLNDSTANKQVIGEFRNPKSSPGITNALKTAWKTDKRDQVAYYIIKDPADNQPLLFFSLQCGEMHLPLDPSRLDKSLKNALMSLQAARTLGGQVIFPSSRNYQEQMMLFNMAMDALRLCRSIPVAPWASKAIEDQLVDGQLPVKAWNGIWKRVFRRKGELESYKNEIDAESDHIIRTKRTVPAVQLVHFCVHEPAREKWKALNMGQRLGRTMFWQFVEPKIQEIRKLVGCEYLYLFAADNVDKNGKLVKLYKSLGFEFREDLYVTKPAYDFTCYFMCQDVRDLRARKKDFLKNFNMPEETP